MVKRGVSTCVSYCNSGFRCLLVVSFLLFVLHAVFILGKLFSSYSLVWGNLFISLMSFLAFVSCWALYKKLPTNIPRERKGILFLTLSILFFCLGDLLWLLIEVALKIEVPIGGFPDVLWTLAYLLVIVALYYFISMGFRSSQWPVFFSIFLGFVVGGIIFYKTISDEIINHTITFVLLIQNSFVLYDIIILFMIVVLVWPIINSGNRFFLHWLVFAFAILIRLVHDIVFMRIANTAYYTGHPVDLLYVLSYVGIIASIYFKSSILVVKND